MKLPEKGLAWPEIEARLQDAKKDDFSWREGRMAVYYYYLDDELSEVQKRAYAAFWTENSLGKRAFPSLAKLENDVVDFGLSLMNAPEDAAGTFTSGGSESIFLAVQTARDWARATKGIDTGRTSSCRAPPIPPSARAGHALGIDVRRVPTTRNDFKADVGAIASKIDDNTIGLVGSAPCYPFGVFDPIRELGALAQVARPVAARRCLRRRLSVALREAPRPSGSRLGLLGPGRHRASRPTCTSTAWRPRAPR